MKRSVYRILKSVQHYLVFFLVIAFVTTCCMMLFVGTLADTMGITLTEENIGSAAKLTFVNVVFLSLLCTAIDALRRRYMIDRPAKRIVEAAEKFMQGDFSVRLKPIHAFEVNEHFNEIIDCFNRMAEELSGTETLRTDFIANVSHELKTPLAVMQNYGTMLQRPDITEEQRLAYAKAITAASRRLADLVSNILKLNKLENQQIVLTQQTYDLGEQLCECLLGFEELWEKRGLQLETEIAEQVAVRSDPEMMALVWNNLFSNAIKFNKEGGTLSLRLKTEGDYAVVQIGDTGCGISPQIGAHIFDKFYQGDTSHATQGNGLGLALVKRIIDLTGSDISVESEVSKGTIFTVRMRRETRGEMEKDPV